MPVFCEDDRNSLHHPKHSLQSASRAMMTGATNKKDRPAVACPKTTMQLLWQAGGAAFCLSLVCTVTECSFVPSSAPRRSHQQLSFLRSTTAAAASSPGERRDRRTSQKVSPPSSTVRSGVAPGESANDPATNPASSGAPALGSPKDKLLQLLWEVPSNRPTPSRQTQEVLAAVRLLEDSCPTPDDRIAAKLGGTWELLWTAQDDRFAEARLGHWINPLENQSYSNNPTGRMNPILPRDLQDRLEAAGWIGTGGSSSLPSSSTSPPQPLTVKSTQSIDLARGRVRNVVSFGVVAPPSRFPLPRRHLEWWIGENPEEARQRQQQPPQQRTVRASMTVDIAFTPDSWDPRRINVKFESSRLSVPSLNMDWHFPLGIFGPTGWLRTVYLDDTLRITRGHKGSVFVLQRPGAASATVRIPP